MNFGRHPISCNHLSTKAVAIKIRLSENGWYFRQTKNCSIFSGQKLINKYLFHCTIQNNAVGGTGRRCAKRKIRLRHRKTRQPTEREGHDKRWRCGRRGAQEEVEVEAVVDNRWQHNERGAEQEPADAPTVVVFVEQGGGTTTIVISSSGGNGGGSGGGGGGMITKAVVWCEKNGCCIYSILMFCKVGAHLSGNLFVPALFRESDFYCNSLPFYLWWIFGHPKLLINSFFVVNS